MGTPQKPRKPYHSHRANQRQRILEAAERLFINQGIDNVSLASIASKARISRVTLYEYFPNKLEIAWAVFQKIIEEINQIVAEKIDQPAGSGYGKIEQYLQFWVDNQEPLADRLRYIALFNYLYAREGGSNRMRGTLEQSNPGYDGPAEWIRAGIADGSVRADLDPDLTSAAIHNMVAALTSRFSLLGANVSEEYRYAPTDLFQVICRNFLCGIRS